MKRSILLFGVICVTLVAHTQTITISNETSGEPLELVTLISESPKATATTNSQGKADMTSFKGSERIHVRLLGYKSLDFSYAEFKELSFDLKMSPANFNLDEVVISASRWRQTAKDVTAKVVTITPGQVALQNPQTAADLLGISGKVFIQKSQQGGGSPIIRGFATNRLIYTVDGIRMNTAIFRGGNIQNVINLDPFATEETEVLFGPSSIIYGSDAIGGVMSFQTLTPQFTLDDKVLVSGKGVARYASANQERTGHFDVNIGWKKWASVTSFSAWDYDHLRQGSNGPDDYLKDYHIRRIDIVDQVIVQEDPLLQIPSAYSQINLMQKLRFRPNQHWDFQYGFHYSGTSDYGRYDRHNRVRNGTARYAVWDYGPQRWMMNNLTINHEKSNLVYDQMSLRLAFQQFEESRIERNFNSILRSENTEQVDAYSANLDFTKRFGSINKLFYGVEYVQNDVRSIGNTENIVSNNQVIGPARYPNARWTSIAAYINNELELSERLVLQGGLRYNQFILDANFNNNTAFYPFSFQSASINNDALTGSLGGVYRPSDTWVIKTSFSTAFRAPNVDDIGKVFDSEPGSVVVPNPDLEAEYAYNIDFGIAKVFGDRIKLDLTAYYTLLENAMVRRDYRIAGQDSIVYNGLYSQVQAIQNAAQANVYGIQGGLEVKLPAGFTFASDVNYQVGQEELDDGSISPSRHAAPLFGVGRLTYENNKLRIQAYTMFQGERPARQMPVEELNKNEIYAKDNQGRNYAPAWYTLNFKAMYEITKNFGLSAGLENLTDQRYRPYSSGISGPGRNFILAVRANF